MSLCYDGEKWLMITLASIAISLTVGLVSLVGQTNGYGKAHIQSYINGEFEIAVNYCIEHAGDRNPILELFGQKANPIQDLVNQGLVAEWFANYDNCAQVKTDYDNMRLMPMEKWIEALQQADEKTVQKLMFGKDCPATQHLYNGICEDNADGKAHPSADDPNRSSRLDCASNEFVCKSEGLIK